MNNYKQGLVMATLWMLLIVPAGEGRSSGDPPPCEPEWEKYVKRCPTLLLEEELEMEIPEWDLKPTTQEFPDVRFTARFTAKLGPDEDKPGLYAWRDKKNCPDEGTREDEDFEYTIHHKYAVFFFPDPDMTTSSSTEPVIITSGSGGAEINFEFQTRGAGKYEVHMSKWGTLSSSSLGYENCNEEEPPPLLPSGNSGEYQKEFRLLPIDIKEVASDQINDSDCNKLPTAKYAGEPNNPMLMATRTGVRAHLAIKVESPEGFRDKIYVGARKVGATTILGSVTVKAPNEKTKLEFDATPGHEIYEVVAGYDQNGNAALDNDEAQIVFKKTPAGSATSGLQYLDKIIIVTESQFGASKGTVAGYNVWGTGYAGDLIEGFSKGSATISGATTANNVDISANEPGLSHPVGGRWNPDCIDKTYRFTFADASSASNDFEGSNAFEQIVEKVLRDNIAALVAAYDGSVEWAVSSPYTFNESKNLIETEAVFIGFNKLGLAFGKVDIGGTIRFSYKKTGPNSITVGSVEVIGNFDDLYDFAYGGGDQARQASMVQAGHATLAKAPEANAGKVFFTRLEFNSGWKNWNRNYTNP